MRLTPTILFVSILLTIESLVGAVAIHNREVYKRAPRAEYEIVAYQDMYCAGLKLGTMKGTGSNSLLSTKGANCALVKEALSAAFILILHGKNGDKEYPGPLKKGAEIEESFNSMSVYASNSVAQKLASGIFQD
ncbi:uncharacterized protein C8R40DRAFT_1174712 [Lentinula edodes]|uniref:uncharacterized protein n=1 Tax=Lentinula edodes TaxID=5353 RepID=UPI001BF2E1BE|nr:uncharacterized protein C8R40DRAFT_1174712 [Lentinula edodes]KAF8823255.1 hypothetical protein HHX47_DHR10000416 [Lentinula edodes]KAH7871288.1 hypothetical protein C8R40DRAFT_1174712 [Lentinula edodes]KAJ3918449.1 hypothetical protein F5877DRAFT_79016 [Lentinula edodes]